MLVRPRSKKVSYELGSSRRTLSDKLEIENCCFSVPFAQRDASGLE